MEFIFGVILTLVLQRIMSMNFIIHKPLPTTTHAVIQEFNGKDQSRKTEFTKETVAGLPVFKSHYSNGRFSYSAVHTTEYA